jgi:adenylate cyclase
MHAPFATYRRVAPSGPWFCSPRCADAYARSPRTYPLARPAHAGPDNDSVPGS